MLVNYLFMNRYKSPVCVLREKHSGRLSESHRMQRGTCAWADPQIQVLSARCWPSSWKQVLCRETHRLSLPRKAPLSVWKK